MFDSNTYKDDWNPPTSSPAVSQNSSSGTSNSTSDLDDKKEEQGAKFDPFGSTAPAKPKEYLDFGKTTDKKEETSNSKQGIDDLTNSMLNKIPAPEKVDETKDADEEIEDIEDDQTEDRIDFSQPKTDKESGPMGGLGQTLDAKTADAIKKLESRKEEKNKEKTKLDEEIRGIDTKIKDLNALAEELKNKIKQFDSKIEDI